MKEDLQYQIAITRIDGIGLQHAKVLIEFFGSARAVFEATREELKSCHNANDQIVNNLLSQKKQVLDKVKYELHFIEKHQIDTYFYLDNDYPIRLANTDDAPLLLYSKGNIDFTKSHILAVVGTRMPSDRGVENCKRIVRDLAQKVDDLVIVSGLAYGIDITAHRAALEAGLPTWIIPAHGLDRIYPMAHRRTAIEALQNGGIITEYPSETTPDRQNFLARNRIIAGLSDATLVVESKEVGGSLTTAYRALGDNRTVFAIPGRPEDERSAGCNKLIKRNIAHLTESADDIIEQMGWQRTQRKKAVQTELFQQLPPNEEAVVKTLRQSEDGMHINDLMTRVQIPYTELSSMLMLLEMKGLIKALPGNIYRAI